MNDWTITKLSPSLGARLDGFDARTATDLDLDRLADLLDEHLVLAIPKQQLSIEDHIRIGRHFGEPLIHPYLTAIPEHPAILQVLKEPDDVTTFGGELWHCDISFIDPPAAVSVLHGIEVPSLGGDTLFANQFEAYDRLSEPMKAFLEPLTATHVYPGRVEGPSSSAVHPVIRVHPRSARKSLFVNPAFVDRINELDKGESDALLSYLYSHQTRPEFQARVSWSPGQVVIWDNRSTQHYAMNDYHGFRRRLQRVTSMEVEP